MDSDEVSPEVRHRSKIIQKLIETVEAAFSKQTIVLYLQYFFILIGKGGSQIVKIFWRFFIFRV